MTTLAGMTPEQRTQCVGMWAQCTECEELESGLSIIDTIFENDALLLGPNVHPHTVELANITPRFDLPRAWNPDGTPPAGRWEKKGHLTIRAILSPQGEPGYENTHTKHRRWVTDWEDIP